MRGEMKLIILLLSLMNLINCGVDPSRVILVDKIGNNFLFRTNSPVSGNQFDMATLQQVMAQKLNAAGYEYPEDPIMHSYSLVWFADSIKQKYTEDKYFKNHTEYSFTHYPIFGSLVNPNSLPKIVTKFLAKYYDIWNHDNMDVLTDMLRSNLEKQTDKPKIIFFHCIAGEDRTGQVYGAYSMRYLNQSYQQVLDFDNQVEDRKIHDQSKYGMNWYCYYLNASQNKGGDCTYEPNY